MFPDNIVALMMGWREIITKGRFTVLCKNILDSYHVGSQKELGRHPRGDVSVFH